MYSEKKASLITFFILFVSFISTASADGGGFIYHPPTPDDESYWSLLDEESQTAFINYEDDFENMILSIKTGELDGERAVWLFPIPSAPEEISIGILKTFPQLKGYNLKDETEEKIEDTMKTISNTQIYPIIFFNSMFWGVKMSETASYGTDSIGSEYIGNLEVHEHIESMGLTSELITAKDSESIRQYMELNNLVLPEDADSIIGEYIGKDYSFVMTWINDIEEFNNNSQMIEYKNKNNIEYELINLNYLKKKYETAKKEMEDPDGNSDEYVDEGYMASLEEDIRLYEEYIGEYKISHAMGISIRFPTEKIYFPLRLTSIYGSKIIPIEVYVTGFVIPEYYGSLDTTSKNEYFIEKDYDVSDDLKQFFNNKEYIEKLRYTKISINEPSKYFTDDLWVKDRAPLKTVIQNILYSHTYIWGFIFLLITSSLASIAAGKIIYNKSNMTTKHFAILGLSNILTIIGLAIATKTKVIESQASTPYKPTQKQAIKSATIYAIILMVIMVVLIESHRYLPSKMTTEFFLYILLAIASPIILEMIILALISIPLPMILEITEYIWDLNSASKAVMIFAGYFIATYPVIKYSIHKSRKLRFIALFSITFLILTYLAGILLKAIV